MVLITGATGQLGSELVGQLTMLDVPFRAMVRDRRRGVELLGPEVELVEGDFERPETVRAAAAGVERMFLLCGTRANQVELERNAIEAAASAGVAHVVKLSIFGADAASPTPHRRWHGEIELALEDSGLSYTHLRPTFYMQATIGMLAPDGALYLPAGDGRVGWIDVRDAAAAAVRPLTEPAHEGEAYDLTGRESVGLAEVAAKLGAASGRELRYVDVSPDAARVAMTDMGVPDWQVLANLGLLAVIAQGGLDAVSVDYARLVGVPPHSFDEFALDYAGELQVA